MSAKPVRVLIVDDDPVFRAIIREALASCPEVQVAAVASCGATALEMASQHRPDVITLDVEMPGLDGIAVLERLRRAGNQASVIMLSGMGTGAAATTIRALTLGAFDFIAKPASASGLANETQLRKTLLAQILASPAARRVLAATAPPVPASPASQPLLPTPPPPRRPTSGGPPIRAVIIGSSTGGPAALSTLLPLIPASFRLPILVVQHMPATFTGPLATMLSSKATRPVREAAPGAVAGQGCVTIAPGGRQLRLESSGTDIICQVTSDGPENGCAPSVDFTMRSAVQLLGPAVLGVMLTGMGKDGLLGCRLIKQAGGLVIAQNEATCVVYGMPKGPVDEGLADAIVPLGRIAEEIVKLAQPLRALAA